MVVLLCRVFREIQEINKNDFDFKEEEEPIDFVETVCELMEVTSVWFIITLGMCVGQLGQCSF